MSQEQKNISTVKRLAEVVNNRDYDKMDELFTSSFVDQNPAWSVSGVDELKEVIAGTHQSLDMRVTQDEIFATGDRITTLLTYDGQHIDTFFGLAPTNKTVSWTSIEVFRMSEDGKIAERWVQADIAGLMGQLGVELPS